MSKNQKLQKWERWITPIQDDVIYLLGSRQTYKSYGEIVKANQDVMNGGPSFHSWVRSNYVTFVSMAIRRQLDTDNDSISLARLISDIRDNPGDLTRADFVARYAGMAFGVGPSLGERDFTANAGGGAFMDATIAQVDFDRLQTAAREVSKLATRTIAHRTTKSVPTLTFDEVDECIETIKEITQKYILLLTASHNVMEPIMQDWSGIFREEWIK
jgi:hypothetical protein